MLEFHEAESKQCGPNSQADFRGTQHANRATILGKIQRDGVFEGTQMHRVHTGWAGILLPPCNEASPTPHPNKSRGTHNS